MPWGVAIVAQGEVSDVSWDLAAGVGCAMEPGRFVVYNGAWQWLGMSWGLAQLNNTFQNI